MEQWRNGKALALYKNLVALAGVGVTGRHLVGLMYLVDLEWVRYTGKQLTNLQYIFLGSGGGIKVCADGQFASPGEGLPGGQDGPPGEALSEAEQDVAERLMEVYLRMPVKDMLDVCILGTRPVRAVHPIGGTLDLAAEACTYQKDLDLLAQEFFDFNLVETKMIG